MKSPARAPFLGVVLMLLPIPGRTGEVEILRDPWGVPHVFADTDRAAFYGLGYATAQDRGFQMHHSLRIIQGRLAEIAGEVRKSGRNETALDHDRKMRTFGFHHAAQRTAAGLDPATRALLQAYCDGVNAWFHEHPDGGNPLFARMGWKPEPWTPADCLASWWHLGQFFATDGTRELIGARNADRSPQPPPGLQRLPPDDAPAVVQRPDAGAAWIDRVLRYAGEHGLAPATAGGGEGPKFSHAWVVGGRRTTTGSAVLVSDPQTPVRNPSLFLEFHVRGATFNARGIGVPGSPVILIGFTDRVAWGVTALGADQADLFRLETDPAHPDQYRFDGAWRAMTVRPETLRVKGGYPVGFVVRETHLGPVSTAFCFAQPGEGEVALKRIPLCETNRETFQGALAMMRARDVREFDAALAGWRFPSANMVFGDRDGNIGYRTVGAIPLRSRRDANHGQYARPATAVDDDWRGFIPHDLMPGVLNPASGWLYSGNHRPVGSWYPLPLGAMTGGGGDTTRSWRLRERLAAVERFTPEDVRAIHFDTVNPARRELVRLGLHLRDRLKREISEDARSALALLEPWHRAGASSALTAPGSAVALELNTFFRFLSTDLAYVYGGGESGLAYFLKSAGARLTADPDAPLSPLEQAFVENSLASAWRACRQKYGDNPATWQDQARAAVRRQRLGAYESLDGFPALDPALAVAMPELTVNDGGTIGCQTAQSYTQWVPLDDPDRAQSILPIGQSEHPQAASRLATLNLWAEARLHPAPLSRKAVEALGPARNVLAVPAP